MSAAPRNLAEVARRQEELSARASSQRAEIARAFAGLSRPLSWLDRGFALAVALRRGAGILSALDALRRLVRRRRPTGRGPA